MKAWKIVTVIPALIDAGKFVVDKIRQRRKGRLTDAERADAEREAKERLDKIQAAVAKAKR